MTQYKVIVTARSFGCSDKKAEELLKEHNCTVKKIPVSELEQEIEDADAIIAGLEDYNEELIKKAKKCRVISRYGVGYDKINLQAANEAGIKITITPGANGDSVADLAVALMMNCSRNITGMNNSIKNKCSKRESGLEMFQKTVGIVGTGRIGLGVAKRCSGFDMNILGYDPFENEEFRTKYGKYVDLNTLLQESDYISLHLPLTEATKNMIAKNQLTLMKDTAILINTARGGIIDEDALYEALRDGVIYAAGLDATVEEPPYQSRLLELENCILTPHAGAATREAASKMGLLAAQNVIDVLENDVCQHEVK